MQAIDYRITTEFIELNQLLKICGLAASGDAGGALGTEGNVKVDGQQELRKRCKIRPGQVVQFGDMRITVLAPDPAEVVAKAEARVALARDKAAKKKQQGTTGGKAAAPWTTTPAALTTFLDSATLTYSIDGVTVTKAIRGRPSVSMTLAEAIPVRSASFNLDAASVRPMAHSWLPVLS